MLFQYSIKFLVVMTTNKKGLIAMEPDQIVFVSGVSIPYIKILTYELMDRCKSCLI